MVILGIGGLRNDSGIPRKSSVRLRSGSALQLVANILRAAISEIQPYQSFPFLVLHTLSTTNCIMSFEDKSQEYLEPGYGLG